LSEEQSILNNLEKRIMDDPLPSEPGTGSFHAIPNVDKLTKPAPEPPIPSPKEETKEQPSENTPTV
jgi:hypothetical protein